MHLVDRAEGTFTTHELERLAVYRAAVDAGFYTDWDGSAETTDTTLLAWLRAAAGSTDQPGYPFTPEERRRLERYRAAVAAGYYHDDGPPAAGEQTPNVPTTVEPPEAPPAEPPGTRNGAQTDPPETPERPAHEEPPER